MKKLIFILLCTFTHAALLSQDVYQQVIRGQVTDVDSKRPLAGATVNVGGETVITDSSGFFVFKSVTVGRQFVTASMIGFEPALMELVVISGKESAITLQLSEQVKQMKNIVVTSYRNRSRTMNEFAGGSARSFSVDETKRYAAAAYDPARMAMNFAGVSGNGDMYNEIVVRGNSPKGILWRLEGIEIPNPNHFSSLGNSGGAITMLSSSTLGRSDFYTGAFPAEFGSATSGVFDLNLRNGNHEKREYSIMLGGLGIELAAEGPIATANKTSYLVNYRYSTLSLLKNFLTLGGIVPDYQDLSYKIHLPTRKAGVFNLFGLGGINKASKDAPRDSTVWSDHNQHNFVLSSRGRTGIAGLSHHYFLNEHAYVKTVLSASIADQYEKVDTLDPGNYYAVVEKGRSDNKDISYRASFLYNNKINLNQVIKAGLNISRMEFGYKNRFFDRHDKEWKEILNASGNSSYLQGYFQWKLRVTQQFTMISGLHSSFLTLNNTYTIEPRISLQFQPRPRQTIHVAAGLHAKPEHLSTYLFKGKDTAPDSLPNKMLKMPKAIHMVVGYERALPGNWQIKTEAYYQHLFHVPVTSNADGYFSMLNISGFEGLMDEGNLSSVGKGRNYGIDLTLEKPFRMNYYVLFTASVFNSLYSTFSGSEYNTRYNRNYQANMLAGKEWKMGQGGKNVIGINVKLLTSGGLKDSPIDLDASRLAGKVQYLKDQYFTLRGDAYFRADAGISYRINKRSVTHIFSVDVQNLTNRKNLFIKWYDEHSRDIRKIYQMGLFPIVNYRIEF